MDPTKPPGIKIAQIFTESAIFSHREGFLSVLPSSRPDVGDVQIEFQAGVTPDNKRGIVRVRVQTKPENNPAYNFDLTVTALVEEDADHPNMPLEQYVTIQGPVMLFPFVRQSVADLTSRGRFGPIWIHPVNLARIPPRTNAAPKTAKAAAGET